MQLANAKMIFVVWILADLLAIYEIMRHRELSDTAQAVWVLIILLIPVIGAIVAMAATLDKRK
jgi:hypothetical protein